ncbi:MAG: hypothetical protein AAB348_04030 [Patescibacteria group bacterium]
MFRHKTPNSPTDSESVPLVKDAAKQPAQAEEKSSAPKTENESLKELIEKNLKWSQIIYEQNRKIHHKLVWAAVASWIKVFLILIPMALAVWYLPPLLKGILNQYGSLLGIEQQGVANTNSLENLLKMLNIDPAKQEQIKSLLK